MKESVDMTTKIEKAGPIFQKKKLIQKAQYFYALLLDSLSVAQALKRKNKSTIDDQATLAQILKSPPCPLDCNQSKRSEKSLNTTM